MSAGVLTGTKAVRLQRGPWAGHEGEVVPEGGSWPQTLAFGDFIYKLEQETKRYLVYVYSPELSPAHYALMRDQADTLATVARERGMTVPQLLATVEEQRRAKDSRPHPAELLQAEAQRLGVPLIQLIEAHNQGELQL